MAEEKRRERAEAVDLLRKVTVVLRDQQIRFLGQLAEDIRSATGAAISRAAIIRALVDVLAAAEIDPAKAASEDQIRRAMIERLRC